MGALRSRLPLLAFGFIAIAGSLVREGQKWV
jgi:hypothetical protein